jgi:leucyl aminopeptidase
MSSQRHFCADATGAIPIHVLTPTMLDACLEYELKAHATWLKACAFKASAGKMLLLPAADGGIAGAGFGVGRDDDAFQCAALPGLLPDGRYRLVTVPDGRSGTMLALAWAMGHYRFSRFKGADKPKDGPVLAWPADADRGQVLRVADGLFLARDLVNMPANEMGPSELAAAALQMASAHGATASVIEGRHLIEKNFPLIWAVGAGSTRAPRLIDLRWGEARHPRVTLVGKGVCFDSGGLDIKPSSAMLTMKKDMGGAAAVLGIAHMVMDAKLPVALRVLIPAVENSISGDAYRPGDVFRSRKGLTVEIGNTDAEGRLVLADALAEADAEAPDLLICMATLTGAARVATGFDLPPFFTQDDALAAQLSAAAARESDAMWRLPLWRGYGELIESKVADLTNSPGSPNGGAITAALFLQRFVEQARSFAHFDIAAWNDRARPGRPIGAEAQTIRAIFSVLQTRYGRPQ